MKLRKLQITVGSLAAFAVLSVSGCSVPAADLNDQVVPDSAPSKQSAAAPASMQPGKVSTSITAKGATSGSKGAQSDKYSQVHLQFWNSTNQTLNLVSASRGGVSAHWENQAPTTLAAGAEGFASAYAAGDANVKLVYQGADDGVQFTMFGETPNTEANKATGQASSTSYMVTAQAGTGMNPTDWYHIQPGQTFDYTGQSQQFVVPAGVTQLQVQATGGNSRQSGLNDGSGGAVVGGVLSVSPGQTFDVGVAGSNNQIVGGWGPTVGGNNYSGGSTELLASTIRDGGGGGATVISDQASGDVVVVAGGSGGTGNRAPDCDDSDDGNPGGAGGHDGSWTGGNGSPWPGGGGQAGANTTTQGQSSTYADTCAPGAGGGGVNGGLTGTDGNGAGGGAGSSSAPGLTNTTITSARTDGPDMIPAGNGEVTFSPVSN